MSVARGGIRGTVRSFAANLVGHFAQRLRKSRSGVSTFQQSQLAAPIDPQAREATPAGEWDESEGSHPAGAYERPAAGKKHATRAANTPRHASATLRWAIAFAEKQMAVPYQWRSMPAAMAEIPELRGVGRGGLQQTLKSLIDDAHAIGWLPQLGVTGSRPWPTRCRHGVVGTGGRPQAEGRILPFAVWPFSHTASLPSQFLPSSAVK